MSSYRPISSVRRLQIRAGDTGYTTTKTATDWRPIDTSNLSVRLFQNMGVRCRKVLNLGGGARKSETRQLRIYFCSSYACKLNFRTSFVDTHTLIFRTAEGRPSKVSQRFGSTHNTHWTHAPLIFTGGRVKTAKFGRIFRPQSPWSVPVSK